MKWIKEAKAWLDGKSVQVRANDNAVWKTIDKPETYTTMPLFRDDLQYRIKPDIYYARMLIMVGKRIEHVIVTEKDKYKLEDEDGIHFVETHNFKSWLGPIVEFEVDKS